ncbi:MAG: ComEC/Rec2 family competence protein [Alterinioella nitratireducens]|uniref:ComEC/Rec2 family competence protein n=1 Tax=Alterinioella nitratireducens TaxID=2735915 RepID=UPI00405838FF
MRLISHINAAQQGQRGALMPWSPVMVGAGVALYFALPVEPSGLVLAVLGLLGLALLLFGWRAREVFGPLAFALALVIAGLGLSALRTAQVAGPVLGFRYYGPIEGRVVMVDRSASDRVRITLDEVVLSRMDPARVPTRVRVSLHGQQGFLDPVPGARIMMTGHLSPPEGPGEPRGFDFQRHAWFQQIGAVGYTRVPALLLAPPEPGTMRIATLRHAMSAAIRARVQGEAGAFATAVLTGDRSSISQDVLEALRQSNIAHLLAISGLHMGLLTGFVFLCLRGGLALIPALALRVPTKKPAAIGALAAGAVYLALSGGNVATERAFIQVAVMFVAVLLDRRAITLRAVAIAALIVLAHRPETLLGPGFQMSFAATTALVAVFNALRGNTFLAGLPKWTRGAVALVISSVVAGAATAPFAAAHFNMIAAYGLAANLLTVPVMGSLVIPAAVVALLLWPLGLDWIAFRVMEAGLDWIIAVALWISAQPGAIRPVVMPPGLVLGLITGGMLLVILWRGRARWAGLAPVMVALAIWTGAERPLLLISSTGRLAGLMEEGARSLSRPRGDGFVAGLWLENDGDLEDQAQAAARAGWTDDGAGRVTALAGGTLWHGVGRRAGEELIAACARHTWVITPEDIPAALAGQPGLPVQAGAGAAVALGAQGCHLVGPEVLRGTGAIALYVGRGGLRVETARDRQGDRPWVR